MGKGSREGSEVSKLCMDKPLLRTSVKPSLTSRLQAYSVGLAWLDGLGPKPGHKNWLEKFNFG